MNELTHLDLFSGIGGFSLAFEAEGFRTIGFAEIDPYASSVLFRRFPGAKNYGAVESLEETILRPTVITCGDPCQRNSNAWRNGTGAESPAVYALKVIAKTRPDFVVRENPSRVRKDAPWPWWRFRSELEALSYAVLPVRLRACCFGADIQRERLLLFAELQKPERTGLEGNVREVLAGTDEGGQDADLTRPAWGNAAPRICRASDGIPKRVDRLKCLGNAVCPHVARIFARAIRQTYEHPTLGH